MHPRTLIKHCVRGDGEQIRKILQRIKKIVGKRWLDDMERIAEGDRAAERLAQGRQRKQRYTDYNQRGLRPRYCRVIANARTLYVIFYFLNACSKLLNRK